MRKDDYRNNSTVKYCERRKMAELSSSVMNHMNRQGNADEAIQNTLSRFLKSEFPIMQGTSEY